MVENGGKSARSFLFEDSGDHHLGVVRRTGSFKGRGDKGRIPISKSLKSFSSSSDLHEYQGRIALLQDEKAKLAKDHDNLQHLLLDVEQRLEKIAAQKLTVEADLAEARRQNSLLQKELSQSNKEKVALKNQKARMEAEFYSLAKQRFEKIALIKKEEAAKRKVLEEELQRLRGTAHPGPPPAATEKKKKKTSQSFAEGFGKLFGF